METRLSYCGKDTKLKIMRIAGGKGAVLNFENLGLKISDEIIVLSNKNDSGPILISTKNNETQIGREFASKIVVTSEEDIFVTLDQLKVDDECVVTNIKALSSIRARLIDMGLIRGALLKVVRYAPLGDPIEIKLSGFNLSLRLTEAKCIEVKTTKIASNGNGKKKNWFSFSKK